jgi:hypothetical protein
VTDLLHHRAMRRRPGLLALLSLLPLLVTAPVSAYAQGAITTGLATSVDILFPPIAGGGVRPLDFGTVVPGTTVSVAPRTPQGAEFHIGGLLGRKSVDITLTLPSALTGPGGATVPLNFAGTNAAACELNLLGICQAASLVSWDPVVQPTNRVRPTKFGPGPKVFVNDQLALYLGAAVSAPANQRAGHYTASVTVVIVAN